MEAGWYQKENLVSRRKTTVHFAHPFFVLQAFPGNGIPGNVYIGQIDYFNSKEQMDKLKKVLENDDYISQGTVNSWFHHFEEWLFQNYKNEMLPANCTLGNFCAVTFF